MKRGSRGVVAAVLGVTAVLMVLLFAFNVIGPSPWPAGAIVVPRDVSTLSEALGRVSPGGTIVLQRHPESYAGPILLDVQDLTLIGASSGVTIAGSGSEPAITIRADGVAVEGFTVTAESIGLRLEAADCRLENLTIVSAPIGIQLSNTRRSVLRSIDVQKGRVGVELASSNGNALVDVHVEGVSEIGVKLLLSMENRLDRLSVIGAPTGISIEQGSSGNLVREAEIADCASAGIKIRASNDNRIEGGVVADSAMGIALEAVTGNTVSNCTIEGAISAGVVLRQSAQNELLSCEIADSEGIGVLLLQSAENAISHNVIVGCAEGGIRLDSSDRNLVMANRFEATFVGISTDRSDNNRILRNTIEGCELVGVFLSDGRENRLLDNEVSDGAFGIVLAEGMGNVVLRNRIERQSSGGLALLGAVQAAAVSENVVFESGFGLLVAGASRANVLGSRLIGNDIGLLLVRPGAEVRIEGNLIERNRIGLEYTEASETVWESVARLDIAPVDSAGVPPVIANNTFAFSEEADIANRTDTPLSVAGNWWGDGSQTADLAVTIGGVHPEESAWKGTVVVGTDVAGAEVILGRILQFALEAAGYRVIDLIGIGNEGRAAEAFRTKDVDIIWWGAGSVLDQETSHVLPIPAQVGWTAIASNALLDRLPEPTLSSLAALIRGAGETIRFAVTDAFGEARLSSLIAAYGLEMSVAGITWTETLGEAETMVKLGAVDLVIASNLEETLTLSGFSALADDRGVLDAATISVFARDDLVARDPEIAAILSALAPRLTTEALHGLYSRVRLLDREPEAVAREFLEDDGRIEP